MPELKSKTLEKNKLAMIAIAYKTHSFLWHQLPHLRRSQS